MGSVQSIDAGRVGPRPQIALIAGAEDHAELLWLAGAYRRILSACDVVAPYEAGRLLVEQLGLAVDCVAPAARGGVLQIASRVVNGSLHAVVAMRAGSQGDELFVAALSRCCDLNDVAFAGNKATAEIVLRALGRPGAHELRSNHPSVRSKWYLPLGFADLAESVLQGPFVARRRALGVISPSEGAAPRLRTSRP